MLGTHDAVVSAQSILEAVQGEASIAHMIASSDPQISKLGPFDRQNIVRTQLVKHAWQKIGRQVLAMHPAVVEEVAVASSDRIPGEVLRVLPYMNPLVIFAEPPVFKSWLSQGKAHPSYATSARRLPEGYRTESAMRLLGFFTYGTKDVQINEPILHKDNVKPGVRVEQRIYPTNAPEADRFGMMLVLEALDAQGKVIDLEFNSMTIFFDRTLTLGEMVDDLMGRYHWADDSAYDVGKVGPNKNRHRKWMREVLSVVIGSLFYLCSTTLEAEAVPRTYTAKRIPKSISRKPLSLYKVGWATGAALTRYRQERDDRWSSEQDDLGHQQDPQHRRSHFKMQPYGPNKSLRKLIFVSAYWTHVERLGEAGVNIARGVPQVDGKGSTRQSVKTTTRV